MKILFHSNAPGSKTGYGTQAALWARQFRQMGHEVVISAFAGLAGEVRTEDDGLRVLPSCFAGDPFGAGILGEHMRRENADLIITLCDAWALAPGPLRGLPVACWMPVDCQPMGLRDERMLRESGAAPIAMSRFGQRMMTAAGLDAHYVPHAIDLSVFTPTVTRDAAREQLGVTGKFTIGINAANKDCFRKGMSEQMVAFARLHAKYPDTALLIHSLMADKDCLDLRVIEARLGLPPGAVAFVDQYAYLTGQITTEHMVNWYSALDLYSACSLAEGFGIPVIEAMACGVPAVATDCSALTELCATQWLVPGEPFWNPTHSGWWAKPLTGAIYKAYETAYRRGPAYQARRRRAAAAAQPYGIGQVAAEHWKPVLAALRERFHPPVTLTSPHPGGTPAVSVCFASRGRPASLQQTVERLYELAAEPGQVEVLVAVDPDDTATIEQTDFTTGAAAPGTGARVRLCVTPQRYGYQQLHRYLNTLAGMATGEWLMWWNDDMRMITQGWDKVIRASRPAILWPHANHVPHANIAPAWPKAWSDAMGHVSPTTHMDTYLQRLGEALGRHDHIPVEIVHDRADVTGGHDDQTYAEGRKLLGPEGMVDEPFPYDQVQADAAAITELLTR